MEEYDITAGWGINTLCNFKCPYCLIKIHNMNDTIIGEKDLDKIINSFDETKKTWLIWMTGGEPFLHPRFIELCKRLTKKHYIAMNTNLSSPLVYNFCKEIDPKRVLRLNCSLHITERERLGLKEDFVEKVKLLKERGFRVWVSQVMWPPVLEKFDKIYEEFRKRDIFIVPYSFSGEYNGKKYPEAYTKKERKKMQYYFNETKINNGITKQNISPKIKLKRKLIENDLMGQLSFKGKQCLAGKNNIVINYEGDIFRCYDDNTKLGNIFKGNVKLLDKPEICKSEKCSCYPTGLGSCLGEPRVICPSFGTRLKQKIRVLFR